MAEIFRADWSELAEGDEADTGSTNLDQVTAGWFARTPNDVEPNPGLALEREETSSGTLSWSPDSILPGEVAWISMVASTRDNIEANAAVAQLMDAGGTPILQGMLMASGQIRLRDQTTTAWTSDGSIPLGAAWRIDLRVAQAVGNARARIYWDASDAAYEDSGQFDIGNNIDDPPGIARWGLAAAQGALAGFQIHEAYVSDDWPPPPSIDPPAVAAQVWDGSGWIPNVGVRRWSGSAWVDATGGSYWDGSGWVTL